MDKRVFICTHSQMPRGDANSNYILHMALSLFEAGWNVTVIGKSCDDERSVGQHKGVNYINIALRGKIPTKIQGHLVYGNKVLAELKKLRIKKDDYVLIYGGYLSLFSALGKKLGDMKTGHVITCVVEWPSKEQFGKGRINLDYLLWYRVFTKWMPRWGKVIAISTNLERFFKRCGCGTFLLPPMIDCAEKEMVLRGEHEKVKFIYAGADVKKDAIDSMLLSLEKLSDEDRKKIELHFTSLTEKKAREILGDKEDIIDEFKNCLFIHGWMEYEELIKLYHSVDFLLLARDENQFTISNFPSKVPEMMKYGIIPVCSMVGDYTELYLHNDVDSLVFKGSGAEQCANAIRRALGIGNEERKRLSNSTMVNAQKMFDYRVWSNPLSNFLLEE